MGPAVVNRRRLTDAAQALMGCGKGPPAMDESNGTCNRRFAAEGIAQTAALRSTCIIGAILDDETIPQTTHAGFLS